ncbi:Tyrosine-protein phosphatase non-receptor type substrate 1 [Myotis brandtii]|uniref:Tyrosine-protein phosphatase non-receptor type substrate 1 n=1 Tax=Myotis brandtii TaxID=109478 RepID=S7N7Q7_MYOBR|nr:Tyrosine-protein phosphatase non-receptor type substrate 1 [Myotis brandtii]
MSLSQLVGHHLERKEGDFELRPGVACWPCPSLRGPECPPNQTLSPCGIWPHGQVAAWADSELHLQLPRLLPENIILGNELPASQTTVHPEGDSPSYNVSSTARVLLAPGDVRSQVICQVTHDTLKGDPPLRGTANVSEAIREGDSPSYNVSSTARVLLAPGDVRSQVICQVAHDTLKGDPPLRGTANLSEAIRVLPTLEVTQHKVSEKQKNVTCLVKNFYPQRLQLTWLENGNTSRTETAPTLVENKDGTFSGWSWLLVNLSAHREDAMLTCQVEHDGQPAITKTITVEALAHQKDPDESSADPGKLKGIFIAVGVVCALLVALLIAALYFLRVRQKKAKGSTSSTRLHEPEKNAREITQTQDNNDITYADLNLPKRKKSAPRAAESNNHTEYASIQAVRPPAPEDTLTYADLDMVHLNRAPKQPAPKPEPSHSEYASVQVQRK